MKRNIIIIDEEKCNGCGECVTACHEGAIGLREGKAVLLRDDYCDGLGDCLPVCPTGAISFEEREALPYDEAAVQANMTRQKAPSPFQGCPGSRMQLLQPVAEESRPAGAGSGAGQASCLRQWPVQIKLVPARAAFFAGADLLVAADCTAFAYAGFYQEYMKDKVTLIGCPKLDATDYTEKLAEILKNNEIRSVTLARMSVPCCGGIEQAAVQAIRQSGKDIPLQVVTFTPDGKKVAA